MVSANGAEVALPSARCEKRLPPKYGAADAVAVEIRGTGPSTRQVNAFGVPGRWDHAEKLIAVELITPPGNWSSYPPHKHDVTEGCPVVNEEIYFYKIAGHDQVSHSREGFGYIRSRGGANPGIDTITPRLDRPIEKRAPSPAWRGYPYEGRHEGAHSVRFPGGSSLDGLADRKPERAKRLAFPGPSSRPASRHAQRLGGTTQEK